MLSMCENDCGRQARYECGVCRTCRTNQPKQKYAEYIPDYSNEKVAGVIWHDKKQPLLGRYKEPSVHTVDIGYKRRVNQQAEGLKRAKKRDELIKQGYDLPDSYCDYFGV